MGVCIKARSVTSLVARYVVFWPVTIGVAFSPTADAQTAAPNAPTNLSIHSITGNSVTIRWVPPSEGAVPTGYVLEGGLSTGSAQANLAIVGTVASFTFGAPNGTFFVRLYATVNGTRSSPSNEIEFLINPDARPLAPTGLVGLANGSALTLVWQNNFAGGTPAGILVDVTGEQSGTIQLPMEDRFSFPNVPAGTYTFALRAFNRSGASTPSSPVTLSFPGSCSPPVMPTNFSVSKVLNVVYASWSPAASGTPPTAYLIDLTGPHSGTFQISEPFAYGALSAGTYLLSARASNICGHSPATTALSVEVPPMPTIRVGEDVPGLYSGGWLVYSLVAPASGTLRAELRFTNDNLWYLGFGIDNRWYDGSSPIVARVPVVKGATYKVTIAGAAPWDYGFPDSFVLSTRIEP